ncbi:serine/threonine protein kinase [Galactobacter caseinivorans]|uniref:non-specific serine/threonine protein kinase n=1 Tax=Galactobacter caseinivorans TaxID=2676123 RepID=A0A496PMC6_9MICC|nr:protein kinase [Galactobacter caseinivorans]RKW71688.1 hypothetical protein DWQ67_02315 [Galactobacter caseinivorans]
MESEREGRRAGAGRHAKASDAEGEGPARPANTGRGWRGGPEEGLSEPVQLGQVDDATTAQRAAGPGPGAEPGFDELLGLGGEATAHLIHADGQRLVRRSALDPEATWGEVPEAWDHPHLVWIKDVERRRRGLLLEHLPGGSAAGLVAARGRLPMGEAVTLLVPVARALGHLHSWGATHGDVHPGNVLFRADGAPVLVDPGLARALGEAPSGAGAAGYSAPETEHSAAADVYGWGALAWFVMTGEAPGEGEYRVPLSLQCDGVSAGTADLIEDCLDPDPLMRPAAADLAPELLAAQDAAPLDATAAAQAEGAAHLITRGAGSRHSPHLPTAGAFGRLTPRGWVIRRGRRREAALALRQGLRSRDSAPPSRGSGPRNPAGGLRRWLGADQRVTDFVRRDSRAANRRSVGRRPAPWSWLLVAAAVVLGAGALWVGVDGPGWPSAQRAATEAVPVGAGPTPSGAVSRGGTPPQSPQAPTTQASSPAAPQASQRASEATSALTALDRVRTAAIKQGDPAALKRVYSSAKARAADEALLKELQRRGVRYERLESRVEKAKVLASTGGSRPTVTVRALATSVAVERRATGAGQGDARAQSTLHFTLVLTGEGWRIQAIKPA